MMICDDNRSNPDIGLMQCGHRVFAMTIFRKRFHAGDRLVITPNMGLNLNQNYSFADKGSDLIGGVAAAYKLNARFALSRDAIFQNMGVSK